MKTRIFLMILLVAVLAPVSQAVFTAPAQLDSITYGAILLETDPIEGRWFNNRDHLDLQESDTITHDGDGSMFVPFEDFVPDMWDNDVQGRFGRDGDGTGPISLGVGEAFTFWSYRPAAGIYGSEHIRELQIYSPGGDNQAVATVVAEADAVNVAVGWTQYTIARSDFVATHGTIDWDNIDLVNFFITCWAWIEIEGEWYPVAPTGANLYIDDFQIIPEPATMIMLGLGGLALLKRRKA